MSDTAKKETVLVSIITLTYHSTYLQDTVLSVLQQSYSPIEYIISDDGTEHFHKEEWEEYIYEHNNSHIQCLQILHHSENLGTVKNMNQALRRAHGKYYIILAGDDVFEDKDVVADWVQYFQNTEVLFATSCMGKYDKSLTQIYCNYPSSEQQAFINSKTPYELFESITKENYIIGCVTAYSKEFWKKYGDIPECYQLVDDYPVLLRALRQGEKIGFFQRNTIKYRAGGVSDSAHFGHVYRQDSDLIYRQEIAPYTQHPWRAWWNYHYWKWNRLNDYYFLHGYSYCKTHPFFWGLLALLHPIRAIKKIKRSMQGG